METLDTENTEAVAAEKMKLPKIEIIVVIDRSGSMGALTSDSVGTFNQFLKEQQESGIRGKLTLAVFNTEYTVIMDRVKIQDAKPITEAQISANGSTALNDAIGRAITDAKSGRPTICMIQTDGQENASREYKTQQIKDLVAAKTAEGWEFLFTGVGVDGFEMGSTYGFSARQTNTVVRSGAGLSAAARGRSSAVASYAASQASQATPPNTNI